MIPYLSRVSKNNPIIILGTSKYPYICQGYICILKSIFVWGISEHPYISRVGKMTPYMSRVSKNNPVLVFGMSKHPYVCQGYVLHQDIYPNSSKYSRVSRNTPLFAKGMCLHPRGGFLKNFFVA